ncbi:MAG TPA: hypothetical protein EYG57_16360 [Planctomycetes bacterium]|nr:hypothetical protein [Planctomycetota bacterium]
MLTIICPSCGKSLRAKEEFTGRKSICPQCGERVEIRQRTDPKQLTDDTILDFLSTPDGGPRSPEDAANTSSAMASRSSLDAELDFDDEAYDAFLTDEEKAERVSADQGKLTNAWSEAETGKVASWLKVVSGLFVLVSLSCPALSELRGYTFEGSGLSHLVFSAAGFRALNTWPGLLAALAIVGHLALLPRAQRNSNIRKISTVLSVVASVGSLLSVYALWSIVRSTAALSIANTFVSLRFGFFLVLVATFAFIAVVAKPVLGEWDPDYSKTSY